LSNIELAIYGSDLSEKESKHLTNARKVVIDNAERIILLKRFGKKGSVLEYSSEINIDAVIKSTVAYLEYLWKDSAEKAGALISVEI
jgi:hypothetical protein